MPIRYAILAAALTLATLFGTLAGETAERQKFDAAAFAAAQKAGKSILIHVSAPWCPTCAAQKPILADLVAKPEFKDLVTFEIDFDTEKATLKGFNVRSQSTLIAFKGDKETARSVGDTKPDSIAALVKSAL
jgi:thiol-disulfide isomerase/thioredoxin